MANVKTCPPCHGDCRQGRDCPAQMPHFSDESIVEMAVLATLGPPDERDSVMVVMCLADLRRFGQLIVHASRRALQ